MSWFIEQWRGSEDEAAAAREFLEIFSGIEDDRKKFLLDKFLEGYWEQYKLTEAQCIEFGQGKLSLGIFNLIDARFRPLSDHFKNLIDIDKAKILGKNFGGILALLRYLGPNMTKSSTFFTPEQIKSVLATVKNFKRSLDSVGIKVKHDMIAEEIERISYEPEVKKFSPNFYPSMLSNIVNIFKG